MSTQFLVVFALATLAELSTTHPLTPSIVPISYGKSEFVSPRIDSVNATHLDMAQTQIFRPLFVYRQQVARRLKKIAKQRKALGCTIRYDRRSSTWKASDRGCSPGQRIYLNQIIVLLLLVRSAFSVDKSTRQCIEVRHAKQVVSRRAECFYFLKATRRLCCHIALPTH